MKLIYGTGNPAKLAYMKRVLQGLPFEVVSLTEAAEEKVVVLPDIQETGSTPLENAQIKAESYYALFQSPVFSCDSGLYLWSHGTGRMLPEEEQPGIHVRGRGEKRFTDQELITHYTALVRKYGSIQARYKNGICLIIDKDHVYTSMEEELWGAPFLLTDTPHEKRIPGFPLDSISLEMSSGKYFYDMEGAAQDVVAAENGFRKFFEKLKKM